MKRKFFRRAFAKPGSALVITLAIIVLISVVTLGYLASVSLESRTARMDLDEEKAAAMADIGLHAAIAQLRDALGPWDNPFANFCTSNSTPPAFYWSISPGRLTRWSYTNVAPLTNYALFSESATTNLVDLNRQTLDGSYPIIGGSNPPDISVKWVNVLQTPSQPVSSSNRIIGRYAFWIDDESAKININVADGTQKTNRVKFLGAGVPAEVSIQALQQSGADLSYSLATNIVQYGRSLGFHSPREILRAGGASPDLFTNNVFNLTVSSRSPDLNVFGQPRMPLIPGFRNLSVSTNLFTNGVTLQPVREIYPGYEQLPRVSIRAVSVSGGVLVTNTYANRHWPTLFQQLNGVANDLGQANADNVPILNGYVIANYLAGTNPFGIAIRWPAFPGSQAQSFLEKYSARQIDCMAMQIADLGAKATSPDYVYSAPNSVDDIKSCPSITWGWVSGQLVCGVGRSPRVTRILSKFTATAPDASEPPKLQATTYIEWWFPSRYSGVSLFHQENPNNGTKMGNFVQGNCLNAQDLSWQTTNASPPCAPLPYSDGSLSYWGDNLLRNDQGIDFQGNAANKVDPDQSRAFKYHNWTTNSPLNGAGPGFPLLEMSPMVTGNSSVLTNDWTPGELRCIINRGPSSYYKMRTNAAGGMLTISGGIAVLAQLHAGRITEFDPAPLDALRGSLYPSNQVSLSDLNLNRSKESFSSASLLSRVISSVIPVNVTLAVPSAGDLTVNSAWAYARVSSDPLVNKFPGDWITSTTGNAPTTSMKYSSASAAAWSSYKESSSTSSEMTDPDSYWLPTIDSYLYSGESPKIPRSARFPSIGYLQYIRTGIFPDDESQPYAQQHGTPFRLLSFAPSTDSANQTTTAAGSKSYPDWALLDLLQIPSTLIPLGGPYGSSTNLLGFGTFGGATAGRINPNGAVIYTTNVNVPQPNVERLVPLQGLLRSLKVNETAVNSQSSSDDFSGPVWSGGSAVDAPTIAAAIEDFLRTNGPFRMPAEICNVPAVAALRPSVNLTRNDLVRQVVGALTTQDNTFSIWVAGQFIQKVSSNSAYDRFETGDRVLGEVRLHFIVERYLDPGADGVYGNVSNPGPDGIVGTLDDPVSSSDNPSQPRYLYRVIYSEQISG